MPRNTSDGMVHPRTVLECVLTLQREGTHAAMVHLEQTEPELANYLFETLSAVYHELNGFHARPARTRRVYRQIELMTLVCILSLRQSHFELWERLMKNPPRTSPPDR